MKIYVSRFSNPELKSGKYTTVRISLGTPRWALGYSLSDALPSLMPYGLLNKYEAYEDFKREYFKRLDRVGVQTILSCFDAFMSEGKDVVLLCYEDIRKPGEWCHRTVFCEWWQKQTGVVIEELYDPTEIKITSSTPKSKKTGSEEMQKKGEAIAAKRAAELLQKRENDSMQTRLF